MVTTQIKALYKMLLGDSELFELQAKLRKLQLDSLVKEGFTREEAIRFIEATNFNPTSTNNKSDTGE